METILKYQVDLILFIQQFHPPFIDTFFKIFSFMGEEYFYLILFPLLLWSIDFKLGVKTCIIFLISSYINDGVKHLCHQPRPFNLNPQVKISNAEGYGFPSGHSQSALIIWGTISYLTKQRWCWIISIILIFLIGLSRIYLGVHFITDVLGGWLIGLIILGIYIVYGEKISSHIINSGIKKQIFTGIILCILLFVINPTKHNASIMGMIMGMTIGIPLNFYYIKFDAQGLWWQRVIRFFSGQIITVIIYISLKLILPGEMSPIYMVCYFCRYTLIGLWVTLGAPYMFKITKLTKEYH